MTSMKLFGSLNSPFVRKVRVLLHEADLSERVRFEQIDPRDTATDLRVYNPLGKVPTFVAADGGLFDSGVICDWICCEHAEARRFLPSARRWRILTTQALADGLLDAGLLVRQETMRDAPIRSQDWVDQQSAKMLAAIARLDEDSQWRSAPLDLGQIAVACALGWVNFRLPEVDWETNHPRLADWHRPIAARTSMVSTAPG